MCSTKYNTTLEKPSEYIPVPSVRYMCGKFCMLPLLIGVSLKYLLQYDHRLINEFIPKEKSTHGQCETVQIRSNVLKFGK